MLKIKAKQKGGRTRVKLLARHPMETGLRKDRNGRIVKAKYLEQITMSTAGKVLFIANLGPGVSKNPYLSFAFEGGNPGDELRFAWRENTGETGSKTVLVEV